MSKFTHEKVYDDLSEVLNPHGVKDVSTWYKELLVERSEEVRSHMRDYLLGQNIFEGEDIPLTESLINQMSWKEIFPFTLRPEKVNFEEAAMYMYATLFEGGYEHVIYDVSKDLTRALSNTRFEFNMSELRFPYDTFIAYFHDSPFLAETNYPIEYIFVDRFLSVSGQVVNYYVYGYTDDDGDPNNSGIMTFRYFQDDQSIKSDELFKVVDSHDTSALSGQTVTETHKRTAKGVYTLLFNLLLYLDNIEDTIVVPPSDSVQRMNRLSNPKKRRKLAKQTADETHHSYIYVGRKYERKLQDAEHPGSGVPLRHKVTVPGHWRKQWYGPRKTKEGSQKGTHQKFIWIEPYVKGTDEQNQTVKVYRVR